MTILKSRGRIRGRAACGLIPVFSLLAWSAPALAVAADAQPEATASPSDPVTLEMAIRRTLGASPLAGVTSARRESLIAARDAAGLKPQPSVELTAENFGLPIGDLYDQFQITGTYNQKIERGGKRRARVELVNRDMGVVEAEALVSEARRARALSTIELQRTNASASDRRFIARWQPSSSAESFHRRSSR